MWVYALSSLLVVSGAFGLPPVQPRGNDQPESKIWALLVAGSNGYSNYRHQADVCHAYQILHNNGIPDENIIVMMYDDIANNPSNPTPGIIINQPGGPNVYEGVPKDYTGNDVNSENFLNILSGNKSALKGIGSGRVIDSGPNDVLFVNFVDHGGPGVLYFPNDELHAIQLMKTISKMVSGKKFSKFIFYVEACHAGSMFDSLLADNTNVFVITASDPFESSYACYFDDKRETYLGDVFNVVWMNDSESESLPSESLHHQFERVRTLTNTSHVEEYGDLDIGVTKLKDVIGFRMRLRLSSNKPLSVDMDVADNIEVPLILLDKKIQKERDPEAKKFLKLLKQNLIKKRKLVDHIFNEIVVNAGNSDIAKMSELRTSQYGLNWENIRCYRELYETFNKMCIDTIQNSYVRTQLQRLVNMCSVSWLTIKKSIEAIHDSCKNTRTFTKYLKGIH